MSVFATSKHLCSWAGLTPQNSGECREEENHSALAKPSWSLSSSPCCCLVSSCCYARGRAKQFPEVYGIASWRCKKRRGQKKAISRRCQDDSLTAIYHMLKQERAVQLLNCLPPGRPEAYGPHTGKSPWKKQPSRCLHRQWCFSDCSNPSPLVLVRIACHPRFSPALSGGSGLCAPLFRSGAVTDCVSTLLHSSHL